MRSSILPPAHHTRKASLAGIALAAGLLAGVLGACAMGSPSTHSLTTPTTAVATSTDVSSASGGGATVTPSPTSHPSSPPTATHTISAPPTATPVPVLHGQVVLKGLGAIGPNTNSIIADVSCPAGYLVAGGGINSGYTNFTTMQNAPLNASTWRAEIFNNSSGTIYAQVQVMCVSVPGLTGQVVTQGMGAIGANTNSTIADVACPAGYLVAGGGVASGYTSFTTMQAAPISTTQWREEIFNNSGSIIYAQAQVICLHVPGMTGQVVVKGLGSVGPNTNSIIADVACPAGYLIAGGGTNSGYTDFTTMWNAPISTTTFRAEIYNRSSGTIYAQAQTMCLKLG